MKVESKLNDVYIEIYTLKKIKIPIKVIYSLFEENISLIYKVVEKDSNRKESV